jgi:hypothetical protein
MMMRSILVLLLILYLSGAGGSLSAQELGRLFLTPAERAYLERLRLIDSQLLPIVLDETERSLEEPVAPPPEPEDVIYRHGGTMRRSDGSYTVWLNNAPVDQSALPGNIQLLTPYSRGELRISDPDGNRDFRVKPGQILNLTQGTLQESYQAQESGSGVAEDGGAADETGSAQGVQQ